MGIQSLCLSMMILHFLLFHQVHKVLIRNDINIFDRIKKSQLTNLSASF